MPAQRVWGHAHRVVDVGGGKLLAWHLTMLPTLSLQPEPLGSMALSTALALALEPTGSLMAFPYFFLVIF